MAISLSIVSGSITSKTVTISMSGFASAFNNTNYYSAGITNKPVSNYSTSIGDDLGEKKATSTTKTSVDIKVSGLKPGTTQTLYGYIKTRTDSGTYQYFSAGSITVTTLAVITLTDEHYLGSSTSPDYTKTWSVDVGTSIQPALSDTHVREYEGYVFDRVETSDGKTFSAGSKSKYTFTKDVTFKYYYVENIIQYTLTVNYKSTSGSAIKTEYIQYDSGTVVHPASDTKIRVQITGHSFAYSSSSSITMSSNKSITVYYERHLDATWKDSGSTYSSISCEVTLPNMFNSEYYSNITLYLPTDTTLSNPIWTVYADSESSKTKKITVDNLSGSSYELVCCITLENGNFYFVGSSSGKIADADVIVFSLVPRPSDNDLIKGCTVRWRNNYYVGSGSWSSNAIGATVEFNSTYPFCDKYFQSVALMYDFAGTGGGYFTSPSTSKPDDRYVIADSIKTPTSTESSSATIYLSGSFETENGSSYNIGNGGYLRLSAYVQTINGTYIPIPAKKQFDEYVPLPNDNIYQFYVWTKPGDVSYTSTNIPKKDTEVKLLASDIKKFIHTIDICCLWLFDEKKTGIDDEDVESRKPIRASHFSAMYDAIVECLKKKSFTNTFSSVSEGDPIAAENLLNLPVTINNLLSVV